jgi:hypothetical protein
MENEMYQVYKKITNYCKSLLQIFTNNLLHECIDTFYKNMFLRKKDEIVRDIRSFMYSIHLCSSGKKKIHSTKKCIKNMTKELHKINKKCNILIKEYNIEKILPLSNL